MLGFKKKRSKEDASYQNENVVHDMWKNTTRWHKQSIFDMTGMEKIEEFLREHSLRWFGHVKKTDNERTPRWVHGLKKGRPKKKWKAVVAKDMVVSSL